jgi:YaaC-like Protein
MPNGGPFGLRPLRYTGRTFGLWIPKGPRTSTETAVIQTLVEIQSESPVEYLWKRLRFFRDTDFVADQIRVLHTPPSGAPQPRASDIKKQATQLGYCVHQAEEYFRASSQVGLPTRPNLLYYGGVSLAKALVLLRKDGNHSFDALRKSARHNHHGLELQRGVKCLPAGGQVQALLAAIRCCCFSKPETAGGKRLPWGHFPLFYDSLLPSTYLLGVYEEKHAGNIHSSAIWPRRQPAPCSPLVPVRQLLSTTFDALTLVRSLPDLYPVLAQCGIAPSVCPGGADVRRLRVMKMPLDSIEIEREEHTWSFGFQPPFGQDATAIAQVWRKRSPALEQVAEDGAQIILRRRIITNGSGTLWDSRERPWYANDLTGRPYLIIDPDDYLQEPASLFVLLFAFGMLARYYPDVWMEAIGKSVQAAELCDSLFQVFYRKFPQLILDQMTAAHHSIRASAAN